jgi:hypothetical protein
LKRSALRQAPDRRMLQDVRVAAPLHSDLSSCLEEFLTKDDESFLPMTITPTLSTKWLNVPLSRPVHSVEVNPYLGVKSDVLFTIS